MNNLNNTTQQAVSVELSPPKALLKWIKRLFPIVAVVFLAYAGWQSRTILVTVFVTAQLHYLVLSVLLWMIIHCVLPICTVMILKTCGLSVSYTFTLKTHIKYLPARYIPGGIWHTAGRMMDFYAHGIKPPYLTVLVLLEQIFALGISLAMGGYCVGYFRGTTDYWGMIAILSVIGSIIGLILTPFILNRQLLKSANHLNYRFYISSIGVYFIFWYLLAMAFICYLSAFPIIRNEVSALEIGGNYLFSWAIGCLAIFAPQGIGVFELVAGHLINVHMSLSSIAVLIAGYRVIALIADSITWIFLRMIVKK